MKEFREPFIIGGVEVKPGDRRTIDLPLPRLFTHAELSMPVHVIVGKKPGPRLFVSAAIHGDEINGVEIIRRLLKVNSLKNLNGVLVAIPVVNVYGFIARTRYLPDRRDLNRSFPGSGRGSLTARLARLFMAEIVKKCTHGIDLHTGANNRTNLPQLRACMDDPATARLAHHFGLPVILNANVRDGSLREAVLQTGIPILVYEGGETLRFDEVAIRTGLRGILSVMASIGMISGGNIVRSNVKTIVARNSLWIRAPQGGIFRFGVPLGGRVTKNEILGTVGDPMGENETEVRAPFAGLIIGRTNIPLVNEGDPLYHIASMHIPKSFTKFMDKIQTDLDPDFFAGATMEPSPT